MTLSVCQLDRCSLLRNVSLCDFKPPPFPEFEGFSKSVIERAKNLEGYKDYKRLCLNGITTSAIPITNTPPTGAPVTTPPSTTTEHVTTRTTTTWLTSSLLSTTDNINVSTVTPFVPETQRHWPIYVFVTLAVIVAIVIITIIIIRRVRKGKTRISKDTIVYRSYERVVVFFSVHRVYKVDNGERTLFGINLSSMPCFKSETLQNGQKDNSSNSIEVKYKNKNQDGTTQFQTVDEVNIELPNCDNDVDKQNKSNGVTTDNVSTSADSVIDTTEKETGSEGNKNDEKMRDLYENTPFIDSIEDSGEDDQGENKNIPPGKINTKNVDQSDKTLEGKDNQNDLLTSAEINTSGYRSSGDLENVMNTDSGISSDNEMKDVRI